MCLLLKKADETVGEFSLAQPTIHVPEGFEEYLLVNKNYQLHGTDEQDALEEEVMCLFALFITSDCRKCTAVMHVCSFFICLFLHTMTQKLWTDLGEIFKIVGQLRSLLILSIPPGEGFARRDSLSTPTPTSMLAAAKFDMAARLG